MSEFLSVPYKKTTEIDLTKPLKNVISAQYSTSDNPEDYTEAIEVFNKLRSQAIWKMYEKYESSLEVMYNYFDELSALDEKLSGGAVQIPFKWKDAFERGSLFSGRTSLTISSLKFEIVCVLFNIAAQQSNVACSQNLASDDGLKLAAKLFQQSAGIFQTLKNTVTLALKQDPTPDLTPDMTGFLSSLMVAQAQEIFVLKAIRDEMKDAIIAKLCSQCSDYYSEAYKQTQKETIRSLLPANWVTVISGKSFFMSGLAQLYQALVCKGNKEIGEEIARLQASIDLLKGGETTYGKPLYHDYLVKAQRVLAEAEKDNNFIYHERIPDIKNLERVPKASLAKAAPFQGPLGSHFDDLFHDLTPVSVHQALAAYDVRRTDLMNTEVNRLREATQLLNSVLASLNLPAALEDTTGVGLPQSLVDKSASVQSLGGIEVIENMIRELPDLLQRNQQILNESERMVAEEKESDDKMRAQFKEKWTRAPSEKLTEKIVANLNTYKRMLDTAVNADKVVREQYAQRGNAIRLLSVGKEAIEAALPAGSCGTSSNSTTVATLKKLMEEVETIKAERDAIESELKSPTVDMKSTFLGALVQDGVIKEEEISNNSLDEVYGPLRKQISESIQKQEMLLAKVQTANTEFCKEKSDGSASNARENFLKDLAAGYDAFVELKKNLEEGTKFYNDLTQHLVTFQSKISDYCFARKTEKEELLKTLTQDMSRDTGDAASYKPPASFNTTPGVNTASAPPYMASNVPPNPSDGNRSLPYPVYPQGMPMPYAPVTALPYPATMPTSYNPYATLPHMHGYGTYPGAMNYPPQGYNPYSQQQYQRQ